MAQLRPRPTNRFDTIVVGGGHNGLVAAAYLGKAGLKVAVLEARDRLGGPCGAFEFLPGYTATFSNSPGSLEPRVVEELGLAGFGLRFARPEATVVHHFPDRAFVGWRDRARVDAQLEAFAPGEAGRYYALLVSLEGLARDMGVSVFAPVPSLEEIERRLKPSQRGLFGRVFRGPLRDLLNASLRSERAKTLLGMVGLAVNRAKLSDPGTGAGLMLRPLSLASSPPGGDDDPRRVALRGSTGLPIGGMGAIVDAIAASCRAHGAVLKTGTRVTRILHKNGAVAGAATESGDEFAAPLVVCSVPPHVAFGRLLDDAAVGADLRRAVAGTPTPGSAFKMVLALDGLPRCTDLPPGVTQQEIAGTQFRIAESMDWIDESVADAEAGMPSQRPIMWGLIPTVTSPQLAPAGKHLLSVNIWHAPYRLKSGDWATERDRFGRRCIDVLARYMPDLPQRIVAQRLMSPVEIEAELGLVEANITHGDMLAWQLFGARPHAACSAYRTPLGGFYLTGAGTWPGGYVSGVPGRNTSQAVLADLQSAKTGAKEAVWSS